MCRIVNVYQCQIVKYFSERYFVAGYKEHYMATLHRVFQALV